MNEPFYKSHVKLKKAPAKSSRSKYTEGVDDSYVEQFLTDANSYSETIEEILKGVNYGTAGQIYEEQGARADDLRQRAGRVMAYLDENRENYDPASYDSMRSQIEAFQGAVAEDKGRLRSARDHYAQWETEDDYNTAVRESAWLQKYQGKSYADLKPMLDSLEEGEERQWLTDYAGAVDYNERMNMDLTAADREIQEMDSILKEAKQLQLEYDTFLDNPLLMLTQGDRYRDMEERLASFQEQYGGVEGLQAQIQQKRQRMAEASQLQEQVKAEEEYAAWTETVRDAETIQKDIDALDKLLSGNQGQIRALNRGSAQQDLEGRRETDAQRGILEQQKEKLQQELQYSRMRDYAALMNNADFAQKSQYVPTGDGKAVIDPSTGAYTHTGFQDIEYDYINKNEMAKLQQLSRDNASGMLQVGLDRSWLLELTQDEVGIYNYLRSTQGEGAAQEFIDFMRPTLTKRQRGAYEAEWAGLAKENPGIASSISILQSPMRAASFLGQTIYRAAGREIDENAGYNRPVFANNAIWNQVSNTILESGKWGALGSFGYQMAMSMGVFLINAAVGQGISGISTAIMGSGAAADTVIRSKDRGLNDDQAYGLGIVAGLSEALTERFSLETLLDPDLLKNGIGTYMLKNTLTEGSEEVASSIINMAADILVTKEKSEWQEAIRGYQQQGYSEGEAFGKAMADQAASLGMDFLGGALSGFVMSGTKGATYYADTKRTGQAMGRRGLTDTKQVQQILDAGANAEKGSAANEVAGQLQKKIDAGQQLSQYEKGRLYQSNPQAVGKAVFGQGRVSLATPVTQGISNQDERWQQAQRLASITGRDIKFYNGAENENGYFDRKTGEIFVNTNAADTVAQVISHELTHSTELAESYADLARYVRGKLRAEGRDWELMKRRKAEAYAQQGHPLERDSDIEAEIVAEYVQSHLLTNEQDIYEAVWESPTLGRKILNWIDGILAKLNNQKAKERQTFNNARELYARALEESQNRKQATAPAKQQTNSRQEQYAPENLEDMDQMYREQYNRGEISEEDYDEYLAWREHEAAAEEGEEELGRQYSISRTKDMEWDKQIRSVLQKDGYIIRNDTLVVDETPKILKDKGISNRPLAIPLSIITKAKSGKDVSHSISNKNLRRLQQGIRNASAIIHNPKRNSIAFVTNIEQNGAPVLVAFQKDAVFDGDQVHKATSIHLQMDVASMLNALPPEATVYVQNKNELNKWVGVTNNLRSLAANVEFTEDSVADLDENVKQYSLASATLNKRDVARDLRAILSRGGSARDLQRYVDSLEQNTAKAEQTGENRYQTREKRNTTAKEILQAAHDQGQSVEEYLRWNPEQFERDGKWRPEALEAMRMEQGDRRYSLGSAQHGRKPERNLSFRYESINPMNSYFSQDGSGEYGLYADGTVIPNAEVLGRMNELTGWKNQGLFAMYTVMVDGEEVNPGTHQLPSGYFTVERIDQHPKVKKTASSYTVAEKGRIVLIDGSRADSIPFRVEQSQIAEKIRPEADTYGDEATVGMEREETPAQDQPQNAKQEESQAPGIVRDNLPTKARSYLARAESKLLNSIGEALSVPRYARYNSLQGIIQEISDAYLAEGTISDEKMELLFDKAYAEGIVTDRAFYEQYKEIKDHLRSTGITISERDRSDIADFDDFRKRAFGTLRILNEGGLPVDTAYDELHTMAPELFPENITHPADQLVRMYEVGQSIAVSQKSLDEYYGPEREEFRKWAKNDFQAAVGDAIRDLRQVKRYAEDQAEEPDVKRILTTEEAEEAFQELKKLRRNVEKARAKNLLTDSDEILLDRMLKGEIGPQHLNPNEDNVKGITAIYEAKLAYESQCEVLAAYKKSVRAKRLQDADQYLETAGSWKDKKAGILYARETMRRNIMDIVPDRKLAEKIVETYFETVHKSEAQSTKFKTEYRDRVRALNLSTKVMKGNLVSEAHAVQLLGEAMDNIRVMENARGRMGMRDGKTLAEWRAVVDDLWLNNAGLDKRKIENAVGEFRKIYDELFQRMNRIRVENGYEPVNYRQGYFPHFQPGGGDGIMGFFGKALGINTQVDALPTTINGLTHTFKPGIQWFGNAQERIGFNTAYDAVEGFDMYIEGVASVIFQTENIQKLRALATQVRYRTSDEGIRKQVDFVRMDNRLTEEEKQREINAIYEHGRFALSNFVAELDEYTNLLANKKSKYDRTMESLIGRRAYTMMKAWENRVGANMIAGNISSALTNFIPLTQAGAQLDRGMILKGMLDTLRNIRNGDGLAGMSDFLTNRRGSDVLVKTWMQKASGVMGTPMELIDNFTSESIVRAAYLQNLKRGLSEAEAMHQADIFTSGVMADRSKGAMPTLFESRNPLFKAFTQFQLEVNNQFSEVFKDLPRNHREKGLAMLAMVLLKYFLGAWMYNELFEKVIGRRSALDPIGILMETMEDLTGYEIPNLFDMIGGERIEKTGEGSIGDAGANLATNILSELPFTAGLTLFGVETDGGRLPAASAVPDMSALWDAATEKELTKDQRWKMIQDELNKLAYVVPPFGGGQISKSWKGIKAYLDGGSYGMNQKGEEILQYPVYKDEPEDAFWSLVRATLLGKNSLPEAQDWVEAGYNSLNAKQTAVYQDMLEAGVKDRDAFAIIQDIRELDETETETGARRAAQRRLVMQSDLPDDGKAVAYYGLVATEKEREWMDQLADAGADQGKSLVFIQNLYDAEKLKGTDKKEAQAATFLDSPLTEEEKQLAVGFIMDTDLETESGNPTQYAKFLTAMETGLTVDKYMEIRSSGTDIEDYLELTDVGIKGDEAADLAISMATLEPEDGYDNVSWIQRCRTVMDSDLTEEEKMQALQSVDGMYESTYEKIVTGHNLGMNVKSYIDLKSIMPQFDENGNGTYTQAETETAINALAGDDNALFALTGTTPNGYTLTDREKAILWQLQNKSWKPYRNPFDREVGQMVYDILTAEDPAEASATAGSGAAFDLSSLFSKMK